MTPIVPWLQQRKAEAHLTRWGPTKLFIQGVSPVAAIIASYLYLSRYGVTGAASIDMAIFLFVCFVETCFQLAALTFVFYLVFGSQWLRDNKWLSLREQSGWLWPSALLLFSFGVYYAEFG